MICRATNGDQVIEDLLDGCVNSKGEDEVNLDFLGVFSEMLSSKHSLRAKEKICEK